MTRLSTLIDALNIQLQANGYHLTDEELHDVAANALMALDAADEPPPTGAEVVELLLSWRPSDPDSNTQANQGTK